MYAMSLLLASQYVWTVAEPGINIIPNNLNVLQRNIILFQEKITKIISAVVISNGIVVTSDIYKVHPMICVLRLHLFVICFVYVQFHFTYIYQGYFTGLKW